MHSLDRRGQKPCQQCQRQPCSCSFKELEDDFRIQATLRVSFLAFLKSAQHTMAQSHSANKGHPDHRRASPRALTGQGDRHRKVPLVFSSFPQMPVFCSPASSHISCLVPCLDFQLFSSVISYLNSFIKLELGCYESGMSDKGINVEKLDSMCDC